MLYLKFENTIYNNIYSNAITAIEAKQTFVFYDSSIKLRYSVQRIFIHISRSKGGFRSGVRPRGRTVK